MQKKSSVVPDGVYVEKKKPIPPDFWYCLCHTHVHEGTYICGIVGFVTTLLFFLYMCFDADAWELLPLSAPSLLSYALLSAGQRTRKLGLYWPHLIVNSMAVLGFFTFIILMGLQVKEAMDTVFPPNLSKEQLDYLHRVGRVFYIKHGVAITLATVMTVITCYMLKVAYRGFRYVHEVLKRRESLPPEVKAQVRDFVRRQQEAVAEAGQRTPAPSFSANSTVQKEDEQVGHGEMEDRPRASSTPKPSARTPDPPAVYRI